MPVNGQKITRYLEYAIGVVVLILIILLFFFVREYRSLTRADMIQGRELRLSAILGKRGPLTVQDINIIQPWMTFDYVNKIFNLPTDYLRAALGVTDSRYPKITLDAYIRHNRLVLSQFLEEFKTALQNYFQNLKNSTST